MARLHAQAARARKLEAQSKLDGLQKDIERLSSLSVEEVHTEEAQVEDLQQVSGVACRVPLRSRCGAYISSLAARPQAGVGPA